MICQNTPTSSVIYRQNHYCTWGNFTNQGITNSAGREVTRNFLISSKFFAQSVIKTGQNISRHCSDIQQPTWIQALSAIFKISLRAIPTLSSLILEARVIHRMIQQGQIQHRGSLICIQHNSKGNYLHTSVLKPGSISMISRGRISRLVMKAELTEGKDEDVFRARSIGWRRGFVNISEGATLRIIGIFLRCLVEQYGKE